MNEVLDNYAFNCVVDEVVYWPPKEVESLVGKLSPPEIHIYYGDGTHHITPWDDVEQEIFIGWWKEAKVLLSALTNIKIIDKIHVDMGEVEKQNLLAEAYEARDKQIEFCMKVINENPDDPWTRKWFVEQFGFNSAKLPKHVEDKLNECIASQSL